MSATYLPVLADNETGFFKYLQEIKKFPSLEADQEYMLAKRFVEHMDVKAAHTLVLSHLKLVAKIAMTFKGYGLPIVELVSEGNIGLMQAVKRFNPDLGFRLSTYAVWWIKAAIQEYILRSWSLVKIGTTAAQKKLFFNLNKIKKKINNLNSKCFSNDEIKRIATELNVNESDVRDMEVRMAGSDISLNSPVMNESNQELIDLLPETRANQEFTIGKSQEYKQRRALLYNAMSKLSDREKHILTERHLKEEPATLEELSKLYNISRERVRQIEVRVLEKLHTDVTCPA